MGDKTTKHPRPIEDAIMATLPTDGRGMTAREIWLAHGLGARPTTAIKLTLLMDEGLVVRKLLPSPAKHHATFAYLRVK